MQLGNKGVQSELNVTPLIDIVLVLLIIFMVLVPTVEMRFTLALPQSDLEATEPPAPESQPLLVSLDADGVTRLNGEALEEAILLGKLRAALRQRRQKVAFFDAADGANFGQAVTLMDACKGAGAAHIGIIDADAGPGELPPAPGVPSP